jgi:hypothetical protein
MRETQAANGSQPSAFLKSRAVSDSGKLFRSGPLNRSRDLTETMENSVEGRLLSAGDRTSRDGTGRRGD